MSARDWSHPTAGDRVFHRRLYDPSLPVESWWQTTAAPRQDPVLTGRVQTDIAIIGGGFTGLSCALHLARDHGRSVAVLEAGPIAWGASGRNGGFSCMPATKLSLPQLVRRYGEEETRRFLQLQVEATALPKQLAAEEGFDIEAQGDGNFTVAHLPGLLEELKEEGEGFGRLAGIPWRILDRDTFRAEGHGGTEAEGALWLGAGFGLNPLKYALGLAEAAARHGAQLFAWSRVIRWERPGAEAQARHRLITAAGVVEARIVVLATNGYTPDRLHPAFTRRVVPAISNVLVTRPLTAAERAAVPFVTETPCSNSRRLIFYYRMLPDNRFLFGARGDIWGSPLAARGLRRWMERRLGEVFPPWAQVETPYFWQGILALTRKLTPALGRLPEEPSIYYGMAYHANGVGPAPHAGRMLARAIASNSGEVEAGRILGGLPPRAPWPDIRQIALGVSYAWRRFGDWKDAARIRWGGGARP